MAQQPANAEPSLEEELVAYLDGELDAEASRRIEERLGADPKIRRTLQGLDRTWEMLDELDRPQVADRFTQSTLEMVAVAAAEDTERSRGNAARRRRWRYALAGAAAVVAVVTGYAVTSLRPDPNRQLVEDLGVLENLGAYQQIHDIEFLRMLREEGVFSEEVGDGQ